jgi:capsular polysaccharide export protein
VADSKQAGRPAWRLYVYNGGFLTQTRVRRILELSGWTVSLGRPGPDDWVGVWGKSPTSGRGERVARRAGAPVLRVEDSFLRSVHPGRDKEPPVGLNLDTRGVYFDSSAPSDLEVLLATHPLDETPLLQRARDCIDRIRRAHLSKFNAFDPADAVPDAPYVLVIGQTRGDASIAHGQASAATFQEMLVCAQTENPGSRIIIKAHPDTLCGHGAGHFSAQDASERVTLLDAPLSPWALMDGATAVYTVTSQLGFEAIFAGHRPRVFGQPFYAGWGLSEDENPLSRRKRKLSRAQLFAGAMILYPTWYDAFGDRLCELEDAISALEAETRAWREDRGGYVAYGMRRWKHAHLQRFFGRDTPVRFEKTAARATRALASGERRLLVWANRAHDLAPGAEVSVLRVEDGFLRSRGLGAALVAPLSLVRDDLGIYYDPGRETRLERLIAASVELPDWVLRRAERLIARLGELKLSKYNIGRGDAPARPPLPDLPEGNRILVAGQVEDDASVLLGCGAVRTNLERLAECRGQNPDAVIIYKPHPDVDASLRAGRIDPGEALKHADMVASDADPIDLIAAVAQVWTMTSLLGFEALIRGTPVTCLGMPFYAGWGLTRDHGDVVARRLARPSLAGLVHASLIEYPRYIDPLSGRACPVETVVDRLASGTIAPPGRLVVALAGVQKLWAGLRGQRF